MDEWKIYGSPHLNSGASMPDPDEVVEWQRGGVTPTQRFTAKAADFDPLFNVAGLSWRYIRPDVSAINNEWQAKLVTSKTPGTAAQT